MNVIRIDYYESVNSTTGISKLYHAHTKHVYRRQSVSLLPSINFDITTMTYHQIQETVAHRSEGSGPLDDRANN